MKLKKVLAALLLVVSVPSMADTVKTISLNTLSVPGYALLGNVFTSADTYIDNYTFSIGESASASGLTLEIVRLPHVADRLPRALSGGQQQRIALARAMVVRPALLLLDEPLSNLDARLRDEMRGEIKRLQQALGVTTILVTHDIEEALVVADRLAVMRHGQVEQVGAPTAIYETPRTRFVAEFVGHSNVLAARVADAGRLALDCGLSVTINAPAQGGATGDAVWMIAPAERIRLGVDADNLANRYEATIANVAYLGGFRQITLDIGGARVITRQQNLAGGDWRVGDRIAAGWRAEDAIVAADDSAQGLSRS